LVFWTFIGRRFSGMVASGLACRSSTPTPKLCTVSFDPFANRSMATASARLFLPKLRTSSSSLTIAVSSMPLAVALAVLLAASAAISALQAVAAAFTPGAFPMFALARTFATVVVPSVTISSDVDITPAIRGVA